jgi:tRNA (guanine-N7-)-methyltransferase
LRTTRQALLHSFLPQVRIERPREGVAIEPMALFSKPLRDVWLEVGFGAGEQLVAQAVANPDVGIIGCEPYVNGVAAALARIKALNVDNVRILDDDARLLLGALKDASLGKVFVLFSDPWPKKRHNDRRFIGVDTTDMLARAMKDGGTLGFASDHMEYVRWALEHLTCDNRFLWTAREPQAWRQRPDDWFPTRYEAKALTRGLPCAYLQFERKCRNERRAVE